MRKQLIITRSQYMVMRGFSEDGKPTHYFENQTCNNRSQATHYNENPSPCNEKPTREYYEKPTRNNKNPFKYNEI